MTRQGDVVAAGNPEIQNVTTATRLSQEANGVCEPCAVVVTTTPEASWWHEQRERARKDLESEIRKTGEVKITGGKVLWDIASANLRIQGNDHATKSQINQEMYRLAIKNHIDILCCNKIKPPESGKTITVDKPPPGNPSEIKDPPSGRITPDIARKPPEEPKKDQCFKLAPQTIDRHVSADGQRVTEYYDNRTNVTTDHGKLTHVEYVPLDSSKPKIAKSFGYQSGKLTDFAFENGTYKEHWQLKPDGKWQETEGSHVGQVRSMSIETFGYGQVRINTEGSTFVYDSTDRYFYWQPGQQGRATISSVQPGDDLFKVRK